MYPPCVAHARALTVLISLCLFFFVIRVEAAPMVTLVLKVFPPDAAVSVDGADAQGGRTFRLTTGAHLLRLSAPGYVTRELRLDLAEGKTLETKLERDGPILRRIGEVRTGTQPKSVQYSPDGAAFVSPLLDGPGVEMYSSADPGSHTVLAPPPPWQSRVGFVETAFVKRRSELWVTQMTTGLVHVFSTADNSWVDSIATGGYYPKVITLSDDEKTAYVSNWVSNDVSVIDVDNRTVTARIPVGGTPRGMALSADQASLYVCIFDSGTVRKIDLAARKVVRTLSFGSGAMRHIVRDSRRNLFYASDMLRGRILVIDADRDVLAAQVDVDANLNTIALSPDGKYLFVSSRGPNNPNDYTKPGPSLGKVYCIDTGTMQIADWTWGGNQPTGLAVSPDGRQLAFTNFLDGTVERYAILVP